MLTFKEYQELYGILEKYISSLAGSPVFYGVSSDGRNSIVEAVMEESSLFLFLAEMAHTLEKAKSLLEKFKEVFSVGDRAAVHDEIDYATKTFSELKDDINYLRVCVKNTCDIDLDTFDFREAQAKLEAASAPRTENLNGYDSSKYETVPDSLTVFRNALNEGITLDPNVGKELGEFVIRSHAYDRLNKDISDGSIYIYTSKPKVNAIIKYALLLMSGCGLLCSLLLLCLMLKDKFADIKWSIMFMPLAGIASFPFNIMNLLKALKNDNFKYSLGRREFLHNSFMAMIGAVGMVLTQSIINELKNTAVFQAIIVLMAISLAMGTTAGLSYFLFQPTKDTKLIDEVLNRHISEISKKGASL